MRGFLSVIWTRMQNYRIEESPRPDPQHPPLIYYYIISHLATLSPLLRWIVQYCLCKYWHISLCLNLFTPRSTREKKEPANRCWVRATKQIKCTFLRVIRNPSSPPHLSVSHFERFACRKELIFLHVYGLCAKAYYVLALTLRTTGQSKYERCSCKRYIGIGAEKRRIKKNHMQLYDIRAHFLHVRESLHQNLYTRPSFVWTLLHSCGPGYSMPFGRLDGWQNNKNNTNNGNNNNNNRIPIQYLILCRHIARTYIIIVSAWCSRPLRVHWIKHFWAQNTVWEERRRRDIAPNRKSHFTGEII